MGCSSGAPGVSHAAGGGWFGSWPLVVHWLAAVDAGHRGALFVGPVLLLLANGPVDVLDGDPPRHSCRCLELPDHVLVICVDAVPEKLPGRLMDHAHDASALEQLAIQDQGHLGHFDLELDQFLGLVGDIGADHERVAFDRARDLEQDFELTGGFWVDNRYFFHGPTMAQGLVRAKDMTHRYSGGPSESTVFRLLVRC